MKTLLLTLILSLASPALAGDHHSKATTKPGQAEVDSDGNPVVKVGDIVHTLESAWGFENESSVDDFGLEFLVKAGAVDDYASTHHVRGAPLKNWTDCPWKVLEVHETHLRVTDGRVDADWSLWIDSSFLVSVNG